MGNLCSNGKPASDEIEVVGKSIKFVESNNNKSEDSAKKDAKKTNLDEAKVEDQIVIKENEEKVISTDIKVAKVQSSVEEVYEEIQELEEQKVLVATNEVVNDKEKDRESPCEKAKDQIEEEKAGNVIVKTTEAVIEKDEDAKVAVEEKVEGKVLEESKHHSPSHSLVLSPQPSINVDEDRYKFLQSTLSKEKSQDTVYMTCEGGNISNSIQVGTDENGGDQTKLESVDKESSETGNVDNLIEKFEEVIEETKEEKMEELKEEIHLRENELEAKILKAEVVLGDESATKEAREDIVEKVADAMEELADGIEELQELKSASEVGEDTVDTKQVEDENVNVSEEKHQMVKNENNGDDGQRPEVLMRQEAIEKVQDSVEQDILEHKATSSEAKETEMHQEKPQPEVDAATAQEEKLLENIKDFKEKIDESIKRLEDGQEEDVEIGQVKTKDNSDINDGKVEEIIEKIEEAIEKAEEEHVKKIEEEVAGKERQINQDEAKQCNGTKVKEDDESTLVDEAEGVIEEVKVAAKAAPVVSIGQF